MTIYDVTNGRVLHTLSWPRPRELAAFSADDRFVAAGGPDGQVAIWDTTTGRLSGRPLIVGRSRASAVFDPTDATRMFAVTDTGELTTWDRHDPDNPRQSRAPLYFTGGQRNNSPSYVTVSRDGRLIAAGDPYGVEAYYDAKTEIWDARSGQHLRTLDGAPAEFAADSVTLPIETFEGVMLYNAVTGAQGADFPISGGPGPVPRLRADGRRLAVTDQAQNIVVYDVRSRKPTGALLKLHDTGAIPLGFLSDGRLVTSGVTAAAVWTLDRSLPPVGIALPAASDSPSATIFLPGLDDVITAGDHGELLRHDPTTGQIRNSSTDDIAFPVVASADGRLLAAAPTYGDTIGIWDGAKSRRISKLPGVLATTAVAWSPTSQLLATDNGPTLLLWDVSDPSHPRLTSTIPDLQGVTRPDYLLFSSDGHLIVTATPDGKRALVAKLLSEHRLKWSIVVPESALRQVAISPDGKTIAVNTGDTTNGRVTLYSAATGKRLKSVATPSYGGVEYLHHGDWLIVSGGVAQPNAQLYDAKTLAPIGVPYPTIGGRTLVGIDNGIDAIGGRIFGDPIAVNSAGTMFSETEWNAPLLWDADPAHWLDIACRIAGRNLTQAEWHQYLPSRPYQITCPGLPAGQ